MPTYNTQMQAIIASLDEKIAALQNTKAAVQTALDRNVAVSQNTGVMQQINQSLTIAQDARTALFDDCCGASCTYTWQDSAQSM